MQTLALTMGDPCGIGPEVILRAIQDALGVRFVIFGSKEIFERDAHKMGLPEPGENVEFVDVLPDLDVSDLGYGGMDERAARLQFASLEAAMAAAGTGEVDGIVTAPWTKALFRTIDRPQVGHTEILAQHYGAKDHVMMLAGDRLRVSLVTTHIPLDQVSRSLAPNEIARVIRTTVTGLRELFGITNPRIAVAGLNPHAGEHGSMGVEETEVIAPTVETMATELGDQASITGPYPADTLFARFGHEGSPFDAVVCMYHDQGLIPLKLLHFGRAANITLGLPIIRTSPDHGSAYDIAGRGEARADSMRYAIDMARDMARDNAKGA